VKPNAVNVFENPVAAFTPSPATATILDAEIDFTDNSYLGATWQWNFGNGIGFSQLQNPAYVYPDTGVYNVQLIVGSDKQCYDTTYAQIEITGAYTLYIPNAFTPNNDNKNDFFFANGYGITSIKTLIFNRWGNKIFETSSLHGKWNGRSEDGNQCPVGVYVYFIEVTDMFGKPHRYEGRVSLIK
jgi:gliding motility-associated-like protein